MTMNICSQCKEGCEPVEETFDFGGTHCTHGISGTHHTANYVSNCCGAALIEDYDSLEDEKEQCIYGEHYG